MARTRTLTIGLLRTGPQAKALLKSELAQWKPHAIDVSGKSIGTLHLAPTRRARPGWADLFDDADASPIGKSIQQNESAVLTIEEGGRTFVLPFGQGRHAIPPEVLEPRFGRLVTLNSIDPSAVRVMDNVRFDGASRTSRTQLARPSSLIDFDLEPTAEIVKGLGGKASDQDFAKRVSGTIYAQVTQTLDLEGLGELASECLKLFNSVHYKKDFGWLDQIEIVADPVLEAQLDTRMVAMAGKDDGTPFWTAVPDIVEWDHFDSFGLSSVPHPIRDKEDLFRHHLQEAFAPALPTLENLKTARVVMKRTDNVRATWSLYRCIYAEVAIKKHTYVLNGGQWYRVAADLVMQVDGTVNSLAPSNIATPVWKTGTDEAAYNKVLTAANKGATLCDRKLTSLGGTSIEMCDMLASSGALVHVKKYGGSTVLSHLFAQGLNSAEAMTDSEFRSRAAANVGVPSLTKKPWNPSAHPIVFVIGSMSKKALRLPFFSRLTLHNAVRRLHALRHVVHLNTVAIA